MNQLVEFNGQELLVLEVNGRKAFTAETVGKALGYQNPSRSISNAHNQYEDELEEGFDWDWYNIERHRIGDTATSTRIYYQTGVNLLGMYARTKPAGEFRKWAKHILAAIQQPDQYQETVEAIAAHIEGVSRYEPRCRICTSRLGPEIDRMLEEGVRQADILAWAAERGERFSSGGISRHNSQHRIPAAAPQALLADPELAMRMLLAKLMTLIQASGLEGLSDREKVKYAQAAGMALLAHRRTGKK